MKTNEKSEYANLGKKPFEVSVPHDLGTRVKHPECVKRIVAELSNGTEIEDVSTRPEGLVAYRIEYKVGPCMQNCERVEALAKRYGITDYAAKGCYNGRVDRVELTTILEDERNLHALFESLRKRKPEDREYKAAAAA